MKALLSSLLLLLMAQTSLCEQNLLIPANRFEFGVIPKNSTVVHKFWFRSTGTDTLVIDTIITGCTCAVSSMPSRSLAPGDSMQVEVQWSLDKRVGSVGKYPRAEFQGPESPGRMNMRGLVANHSDSTYPLLLKPHTVELARTSGVDIDSISFEITNRAAEDLHLTVVSYPVEQCQVILPESIPGNGTATGIVKVLPEYSDIEFVASVTIEVDDQRRSRLTMPIRRKFYE